MFILEELKFRLTILDISFNLIYRNVKHIIDLGVKISFNILQYRESGIWVTSRGFLTDTMGHCELIILNVIYYDI
jgi:hypothetical protein